MSDQTQGRHLLSKSDFVTIVDEEGNEVGSVPKHWDADMLPPGTKRKGRSSGSTSGSGSSFAASEPAPASEPGGNASTEAWVEFAKSQGATDADLVDDKGEPLSRDALRDKYGAKPV